MLEISANDIESVVEVGKQQRELIQQPKENYVLSFSSLRK
jgi:hypothetical protein